MPDTLEERIAQLEAREAQLTKQQATLTLGLRRLLENKLDGPDSAAGYVVALEGGNTRVEVRHPFEHGAAATPAEPAIIVRDVQHLGMGAGYPSRSLSSVTAYIVHHSQTRAPTSEEDALAVIREIDDFHRRVRGWPGFAYNGAIWQDRYFRVRTADRMGWHSAGADLNQNGIGDWNEKGFAVVLLGDYSSTRPDDVTLNTVLAAKRLEEQEVFGRTLQLRGHRDGWATECPGKWWTNWLVSVR